MALIESKTGVARKAPSFSLPNVDGKVVSLDDFIGKFLVLIFTCNHCPYAQAAWPELVKLAHVYQKKGVDFAAINSNDPEEYPDDAPAQMKVKAKEWKISFPYLFDETQEVARAYDAQCTPDIYVYDQKRNLVYHGRLNSNWPRPPSQDPAHAEPELKNALEALLVGRSVKNQHPSMGCSIKWKR